MFLYIDRDININRKFIMGVCWWVCGLIVWEDEKVFVGIRVFKCEWDDSWEWMEFFRDS